MITTIKHVVEQETGDTSGASEIVRTSDANLADADADARHTSNRCGTKHASIGRTTRRRSRCRPRGPSLLVTTATIFAW